MEHSSVWFPLYPQHLAQCLSHSNRSELLNENELERYYLWRDKPQATLTARQALAFVLDNPGSEWGQRSLPEH